MSKEYSYKAVFWSLVILAMIMIVLLLTKCEDKKDCYVCTIKTQWFYGDHTVTSEREYPYCDVGEDFIENFMKINTYTDTVNHMIQTCKCK